jgi:kinesin family protein 1
LTGVNIESNPEMEALLGVSSLSCIGRQALTEATAQKRFCFTLFTSTNSYALSASSLKDLQSWSTKLDPTRQLS